MWEFSVFCFFSAAVDQFAFNNCGHFIDLTRIVHVHPKKSDWKESNGISKKAMKLEQREKFGAWKALNAETKKRSLDNALIGISWIIQ